MNDELIRELVNEHREYLSRMSVITEKLDSIARSLENIESSLPNRLDEKIDELRNGVKSIKGQIKWGWAAAIGTVGVIGLILSLVFFIITH